MIEFMKKERESAGLSWDSFGIQAQVQFQGGDPERWRNHFERWEALGCTHIAIATHNAGNTNIDEHLASAQTYFDAVL